MARRCEVMLDTGVLYPGGGVANWPRVIVRGCLPDEMFDVDGANPARSDGGDVWASLDGTVESRVPMDVVFFSTDDDPANGRAELWVRLPGEETEAVWIHWGGYQSVQPAAGSTYGRYAVWSNHFGAVYRFNENPGNVVDRSGNGRGLTLGGTGQAKETGVSGMLSPYWDMTHGSMQTRAAWLSGNWGTYTITAQVTGGASTADEKIFGESGSGGWIYIYRDSSGTRRVRLYLKSGATEDSIYMDGAFTAGEPVVMDFIRDGGDVEILVNGVSGASGTTATTSTYATSTQGVMSDDGVNFQGWPEKCSIFTIATVARDAAWMSAWTLMLLDPEMGVTVGTPEAYIEPMISVYAAGAANQVAGRRQC
jgi:hypothetical protein